MLANGIKLGYKKKGSEPATYTDLPGLKEVPEMGDEPEKVDNTCLSDKVKQYEYGIGDPGDLEFKFKYENSSATSPYRVLRAAAESKEVLSFEETFPDGTKFNWDAQVSVKLGGGGVNGVIDFTLKMALQSEIAVVDPS
ncbi:MULTISPECIES: phage tail tube protein [Clostridium]|uniref:phage tail tube protein n=1 Tax=Clostridium TaxID=1485 RepID=UPI0018AB55AB|nr:MULTISPECIES: phage tail tube protein [Clostridium]MBS5886696.1 phage tail protein [Clostridium sp.]MDB1969425.1 phage tail tube protein [Clostridium tertium]MDU7947787.1 phage tail tube protein [Clostridium sp.]